MAISVSGRQSKAKVNRRITIHSIRIKAEVSTAKDSPEGQYFTFSYKMRNFVYTTNYLNKAELP